MAYVLEPLLPSLLQQKTTTSELDTRYLKLTIIDTKANILALSPDEASLAIATDTLRYYFWDGSNWLESPIELTSVSSLPNIGAVEGGSRKGYGADYITDKVISYCKVGGGGSNEEGSIRQVDGVFQIYLNSIWNDIVINFVFREDSVTGSYELEHQPVGLDFYYEISSGNSNKIGIDGKPILQQYGTDIGAYQKNLIINCGSF